MTKPELHIVKRLKDLLPPLTKEERDQLKANIEADGRATDPILYWHDGKKNVVVDGMHRFPIVTRLALPFKTEAIKIGDTYEEAEAWIWNHQAGRRNLSREAIGKWYNQIKATRGGDRKTKVANATLKDAAKHIGGLTGKSPSAVKQSGVRVAALGKCTTAIQRGIESGKIKATDAEVKTLSGLNPINQGNIASDIRKGIAKTVTDAMAKRKIKQPAGKKPAKAKPAKKKPPKKLDRAAYYKEWERAVGPVMRTLDKIAKGVGEKDGEDHTCVLEALDHATRNVAVWMGVKTK